jgi:hypothetical protein
MDLNNYNKTMENKCHDAVNYSVLANKDQFQIEVEDDNILPISDSPTDEIGYTIRDSAVDYHSFIHIGLPKKSGSNPVEFTVAICPFAILSSEGYRNAIETLVQATYDPNTGGFGQKTTEIGLVNKEAADIVTDNSLDPNEKNRKLLNSRSAFYTLTYNFPSIAETFQLIKRTPPKEIAPYRSQHCYLCKLL